VRSEAGTRVRAAREPANEPRPRHEEAGSATLSLMLSFPPQVEHILEGWTLFWADLELVPCDPSLVADLRESAASSARERLTLDSLSSDEVVAAVRQLFRRAGTDPTRYRPSSEALLRRILKGEPIPAISPVVDLNNALSAMLAVPVCVMDARSIDPPFVFRRGEPGESYESLRGPFNLEGKPLLADGSGPADTPITGGVRVKARDDSTRLALVAYLPASAGLEERTGETLRQMLGRAPLARMSGVALTG
jgi:DNA/RNA-binding domain of Phe-tRNA-synthetase-like protein